MSFGWSVGDIASAITLLVEVVKTLDSAHGAANDYQEGILFLNRLIHTLEPLKTLTDIDTSPTFRDEICREVDAIKTPVEEFLAIVSKYESGLGTTAQKGHCRHVGRKLQWHFIEAKKLEKLEKNIGNHMRALDTLLQRLTIDIISSTQKNLPEDLRKIFVEVLDDQLRSVFLDGLGPLKANILALREELSQGHQALLGYLEKNMLVTSALDTILRTIMDSRAKGLAEILEKPRVTDVSDSTEMVQSGSVYKVAQIQSDVSILDVRGLCLTSEARLYHASQFCADKRVDTRLRRWWADPKSTFLWIQEPLDRSTSPISTAVLIAAQRADIRVIRFSCVDECGTGTSISTRLGLLIKLVHSFIYQLVQHLQSNFASEIDFTSSRFNSVGQSVETLPLALDLLRDLLSLDSTPLICEIDGFHKLEDRRDVSLTTYLIELLKVLRLFKDSSTSLYRIVKLLITTPGQSLILLEVFGPEERLDASIPTEEHYCSITSSLARLPYGTGAFC